MNRGRCPAVWHARLAAALAVSMLVSYSRRAGAQDSPTGEPSFKPSPSSAPAANDQSGQILGPIQRLPASAYPTDPIRGIYGGSLWSTFAGLQWPYYPKTGIGVSGYIWFDTGYEHIKRGSDAPTDQSITYFVQQGRMSLRVTPTWSNGTWFVQGQSELIANHDQSQTQPIQADVDDLWVKFGMWKAFDLQVGRFMGWEVYHFGMGLDLYTLERQGATTTLALPYPSIYGVTTEMYYPESVGQAALHLYPLPWLRFEWQGRYGNEGAGVNEVGTRPIGIADLGWMKFKFGGEYQRQTQQVSSQQVTTDWGFGGALQFIFDPIIEFGINAAYGQHIEIQADGSENVTGSTFTYSTGGFLNFHPGLEDLTVGVGANYTYLQDKFFSTQLNRFDDYVGWQGFLAVQYLLLKHLFIKGVGGYALADFNPTQEKTFANQMLSFRLRLQYLF